MSEQLRIYLDCTLNNQWDHSQEIRVRIGKSRNAFIKLEKISPIIQTVIKIKKLGYFCSERQWTWSLFRTAVSTYVYFKNVFYVLTFFQCVDPNGTTCKVSNELY